ncbi:hypothetical protein BC833DRAFT_653565 [Globomyces pollinis-pini]|nr:hypothetical protein BC833DRAFT_653565 [Globomyces pollinis-pini]
MERCCVCQKKPKYTCPGCSLKSCSLDCVKQHKVLTSCDGVRDKVAFVPRSKYNINNLTSDYTLLENYSTMSDARARTNIDLVKPNHNESQHISKKQKLFSKNLSDYQINIKFMPSRLSRSKTNQTRFQKNSSTFFWTLELAYKDANVTIVDHNISDKSLIKNIVDNHLEERPGNSLNRLNLISYVGKSYFVYLKNELRKPNEAKYYQLDLDSTLADSLRESTLIEFPTIEIYQHPLPENQIMERTTIYFDYNPLEQPRSNHQDIVESQIPVIDSITSIESTEHSAFPEVNESDQVEEEFEDGEIDEDE